jgi:Flagellar transcriptional activator (FlhC)
MRPIPEEVRPDDPCWEVAFLELAHGLIKAGARSKIVTRFTDLPASRVRRMYRALLGVPAPSGPILQATARSFAMVGKHTSAAWSVQVATFLACYERLGTISQPTTHRGWRMLHAFNAYLSVTDPLHAAQGVKRLDINQAYALLVHCGFLNESRNAELQRRQCPICRIRYPVVTSEPLRTQRCPVCAINANALRLSGRTSRARGRTSLPKT